jgi:hypothetical protein
MTLIPAEHPLDKNQADVAPAGPVIGKPEEKKADEKPAVAGPDAKPEIKPDAGKPEVKDSKAAEVKDDGQEFQAQFQTLYQEENKFLDSFYPGVKEEFQEFRKTGKAPEAWGEEDAAEPAIRETMEPGEEDEDELDRPMTRREYRQELERREKTKETEAMRRAFSEEHTTVKTAIAKLQAKPRIHNGEPLVDNDGNPIPLVSPAIFKKAVAIVGDYGIPAVPGGPSRFYRALLNTIDHLLIKEGHASFRTKISAEESDRVRATLLASQPGGTPAGGVGELTPRQKEIQELRERAAKTGQPITAALPKEM